MRLISRGLFFTVLCAGAASATAAERPSFVLPDVICAAPGLECNVYFGSVFDTDSPRAYSFCTECAVGRCQNERWTWTPTEADAGRRHRLVLEARSDFGPAVSCTTTVEVAGSVADRSRRATFALLGDSLTNARYQDRILSAVREAGWTNFTAVGSRSGASSELAGVFREGEAAHDGYGGFTPFAFLNRYSVAVDEIDNAQSEAEREQLKAFGVKIPEGQAWRRGLLKSPLVRLVGGEKTVDVQAWLDRVNGGRAPDFLLIELGVNGTCAQKERDLVRYCEEHQVADLRRLIREIRKVAPRTLIAVAACSVGADQDAYGRNYGCSISAVQGHRNLFHVSRCWRELVRELNDRGDSRVRYVHFGGAIDPFRGFIRETAPAFAHSKEIVSRIGNALHPGLEGGRQMGDAVAAFLLARLGETEQEKDK